MRRAVENLLSTCPGRIWVGILGAATALDIYCDRNSIVGDSLSECIRVAFHTETPQGRAAFVAAYAVGSAWFIPHIIRRANEERGQRCP